MPQTPISPTHASCTFSIQPCVLYEYLLSPDLYHALWDNYLFRLVLGFTEANLR